MQISMVIKRAIDICRGLDELHAAGLIMGKLSLVSVCLSCLESVHSGWGYSCKVAQLTTTKPPGVISICCNAFNQ